MAASSPESRGSWLIAVIVIAMIAAGAGVGALLGLRARGGDDAPGAPAALPSGKSGILECDRLLEDYRACVPRLTADMQRIMAPGITQFETLFKASATGTGPTGGEQTRKICQMLATHFAQTTTAVGCTFR